MNECGPSGRPTVTMTFAFRRSGRLRDAGAEYRVKHSVGCLAHLDVVHQRAPLTLLPHTNIRILHTPSFRNVLGKSPRVSHAASVRRLEFWFYVSGLNFGARLRRNCATAVPREHG